MVLRYQTQLNRSYEGQTKLMEQADGSRLHRPSDDAVGYSKYLRYSLSYGENAQYQANVKTAVSWMKNSDSALVDICDRFRIIETKANQAQGTNTVSDMKAIASEMLVNVQQAVSDANSQVGGRYLFSGQSDLIQPYSISTDMYDRGVPKTLDDRQKDFFYDAQISGDMMQMLTLSDDAGNEYYLNTRTGNVYAKDFMDETYKDRIARGHEHVEPGDEAGTVAEFKPEGGDDGTPATASGKVSDYFDANGVIKLEDDGNPPTLEMTKSDGSKVALSFTTAKQYIVTYSGDRKEFSIVKENGAVQPASDTINATGVDISGYSIFDGPDSGNIYSGANAFNDMLTVVAKTAEADDRWMSSDGKTLAHNAYISVNAAQTKLGARQRVYSDCEDMLTTQSLQILQDITDVSATDVAKLAVEMMQAATVYNLSLSVGSRIIPPTLADYL